MRIPVARAMRTRAAYEKMKAAVMSLSPLAIYEKDVRYLGVLKPVLRLDIALRQYAAVLGLSLGALVAFEGCGYVSEINIHTSLHIKPAE